MNTKSKKAVSHIFVIGKTDIGKFRDENQDRFRITMIGDNTAFAVVCDGMGGAKSGGLAASVASDIVYERISLSYREDMESKSIKSLLISAFSAANSVVHDRSINEVENSGMGTTCVATLVNNGKAYIASVGDSRAYLLNNDSIKQITNDHTVVEYLHSKGIIDEDEMKSHRMKNLITRAVGIDVNVDVDYFEIDVTHGDVLLVCTDGLTNYCSDEFIYSVVYKKQLEQSLCELIDHSNMRGGKDNITAVLISV